MVDLELFLDEYPWWGLGTPHWSVVYEPDPGADQSAMELVGYQNPGKR